VRFRLTLGVYDRLSRSRRHRLMSSSLLALATLGPYALVAQPQTDNVAAGWLDRATLTGDWGGARSSMEGRGINFSAHFVTESATNPIGGLRQTARYTQQIDFGFDLDLSRLAGDPGGKIQILLLDRAGRSLSADAIGNQFAVQELYGAGQNFRLVELSYEQSMFANKLSFHLGWAPSWKLLRFAAGLLRFPKWLHLCARDAYDNQQRCSQLSRRPMGGHMKVEPTREFYIQSGIFQVNPNEGNSDRGFDLSLGSTGVFIPLEVGWLPGRDTGPSPGIYRVGAYYNSSATPDVLQDVHGLSAGFSGSPFAIRDGRWGAYGMADQVIQRDRLDARRFSTIGAIAGVADRATSTFRYLAAVGGVHQGTFSHRDNDFVSVMFAHARTNPRPMSSRKAVFTSARTCLTTGARSPLPSGNGLPCPGESQRLRVYRRGGPQNAG
jgi:porin